MRGKQRGAGGPRGSVGQLLRVISRLWGTGAVGPWWSVAWPWGDQEEVWWPPMRGVASGPEQLPGPQIWMKIALPTKAPPALAPPPRRPDAAVTGSSQAARAVTHTLHAPEGHCLLSLTRSLLPQGRALPRPPPPVDFSSTIPLGRHGLSAHKPWPASSIALLSICSLALEGSSGHISPTSPTLLIPG